MKNSPILMSPPMVCSTLDGIKFQTRRVIDPQPDDDGGIPGTCLDVEDDRFLNKCRYGVVGDRLWVKENWRTRREWDKLPALQIPDGEPKIIDNPDNWPWMREQWIHYHTRPQENGKLRGKLRPCLFMRQWMSRLCLELVEVRVQRLHAITPDDAIAEGLGRVSKDGGRTFKYGIPDADGLPGRDDYGWDWKLWQVCPVVAYRQLWDSINAKRGYPWYKNPWVWALSFKRVPLLGDDITASFLQPHAPVAE